MSLQTIFPKVYCFAHPKILINRICLDTECQEPSLHCVQCKKEKHSQHKENIMDVQEYFSLASSKLQSFWQKYEDLKRFFRNKIEDIKESYQNYIFVLQSYVENFCSLSDEDIVESVIVNSKFSKHDPKSKKTQKNYSDFDQSQPKLENQNVKNKMLDMAINLKKLFTFNSEQQNIDYSSDHKEFFENFLLNSKEKFELSVDDMEKVRKKSLEELQDIQKDISRQFREKIDQDLNFHVRDYFFKEDVALQSEIQELEKISQISLQSEQLVYQIQESQFPGKNHQKDPFSNPENISQIVVENQDIFLGEYLNDLRKLENCQYTKIKLKFRNSQNQRDIQQHRLLLDENWKVIHDLTSKQTETEKLMISMSEQFTYFYIIIQQVQNVSELHSQFRITNFFILQIQYQLFGNELLQVFFQNYFMINIFRGNFNQKDFIGLFQSISVLTKLKEIKLSFRLEFSTQIFLEVINRIIKYNNLERLLIEIPILHPDHEDTIESFQREIFLEEIATRFKQRNVQLTLK